VLYCLGLIKPGNNKAQTKQKQRRKKVLDVEGALFIYRVKKKRDRKEWTNGM
jgi:hypothetical protein